MPSAPPRRCLKCRALFTGHHCPTCNPPWARKPASWAAGGNSRWRRLRAWWLANHPLCAVCGAVADTVDHIDGTDYAVQRYDPTMLRSLCTACHRIRTARQGSEARRRASGPPTVP